MRKENSGGCIVNKHMKDIEKTKENCSYGLNCKILSGCLNCHFYSRKLKAQISFDNRQIVCPGKVS